MSLYKDPLEAIFKAAETQNNLTLNRSQYTLGTPVPYSDPQAKSNTEIILTARSPASPYEGSVPLHYTRLDLADLLRFLPSPLLAYRLTSIADVIDVMNKNYGLNFVASDLMPGAVSLTDDVGTVKLVATAASLGWIGEVDLLFSRGNIDINTALTVKSIDGMVYPNRDPSKPFGEMETYWRDFTAQTAVLETLSTETTDLIPLRDALRTNTGKNWVHDASGRYSLLGATITYNGLAKDYARSNSKKYGYVCVVTLGNGSLGLSGDLILHYGLPPLGPG